MFQKVGQEEKLKAVADSLRELKFDADTEAKVLMNLSEFSSWYQDEIIKAAIYERKLEIDPTDSQTRFQLAYLHSQIGNEGLAMHHYEKIPYPLRDGMTWNNLGVAYQHFSLSARSVSAYRNAADKKNTLAMANIAYLFIGAGFITEAREIIEVAQKEPSYHKNVISALSRANEIQNEEDKQHAEKLTGVVEKSTALARVGELISRSVPDVFPVEMVDNKCTLTVSFEAGTFSALGIFKEEKSQKVPGGLFGATSSTEEIFNVRYIGRVIGEVVVGERTIDRSSNGTPITLFGIYPAKEQFLLPLPGKTSSVVSLLAGKPQTVQLRYASKHP